MNGWVDIVPVHKLLFQALVFAKLLPRNAGKRRFYNDDLLEIVSMGEKSIDRGLLSAPGTSRLNDIHAEATEEK